MTRPETVVVENPQSGSGDHAATVRERVALLGYGHERTRSAGDAIRLAEEAADAGASTIVAAGGDGTVNEVVRGIDRAGALGRVTFGILPLGTGNNFATQIGVDDLETAFEVVENGERRDIDLGRANERPFVNSCIAGLAATASSETSAEMKSRLGVLAYVVTTLRSLSDFESLRLSIHSDPGTEPTDWTGEALCVLVGNGRRFSMEGTTQADMEDGRFDVAVIEDVPTIDLMGDAIAERLLGRDSPDVVRFQPTAFTIENHDLESVRFSLDGEIIQECELTLEVQPGALTVAVGDTYDPDPR
jgi:YegS/Rv2252/BmrU family lipid kinase